MCVFPFCGGTASEGADPFEGFGSFCGWLLSPHRGEEIAVAKLADIFIGSYGSGSLS